MRILIIYPSVSGLKNGNLVTAERWQRSLSALGHNVEIAATFDEAVQTPDLMIALHAVKSSGSIKKCKATFPTIPIIVVLTGTDIYSARAFETQADAMFDDAMFDQTLTMADRIVVLQDATADDVGQKFRDKVRVIYQAITPINDVLPRSSDRFDVCVVGHLRPVKDPFQAVRAICDLPKKSKICVTQIGAAMSDEMCATAQRHAQKNDRYRWVGEVSRDDARQRIGQSHLLVNSSKVEGGAAVICEAVVAGTPILATRIAGNVGFLGQDYEGLFEVGDTEQLRDMLLAAENNADFYQQLKDQCEGRKHLFDPDLERCRWADLIEEFDR